MGQVRTSPRRGALLAAFWLAAGGPLVTAATVLVTQLLAVTLFGWTAHQVTTGLLDPPFRDPIDAIVWAALGLNLVLLLNVLPGLPLDGGRMLHALLWSRRGDRMDAVNEPVWIGQALGYLSIACGLYLLARVALGDDRLSR